MFSPGADHAIDPMAGDVFAAVRAILPGGADLLVDTSGQMPMLTASLGMIDQAIEDAHGGKAIKVVLTF